MAADHAGHILHWLDLGAQDVCAPLLEHGGDDVDLLAIEDGAQAFAVEPGAGGAFGGGLADQGIEVGASCVGQPLAILEQRSSAGLSGWDQLVVRGAWSGRGRAEAWAMTWNLSKVMRARGRWSATPRMKAGDMSMLTVVSCSGRAVWAARCTAKRAIVAASRPWVTNTTLRSSASAAMVK